jgi:hypothetical protein
MQQGPTVHLPIDGTRWPSSEEKSVESNLAATL